MPGREMRGLDAQIWRDEKAYAIMAGAWGPRVQTFMITLRLSETIAGHSPKAVSDDPIFAAHKQPDGEIRIDREVSALGCVELFELCSPGRKPKATCSDLPPSNLLNGNEHFYISDSFIDIYYPGIMSVWASTLSERMYQTDPRQSRLSAFFDDGKLDRVRWQDDVVERFTRTALRARHADQIAAEEDLVDLPFRPYDGPLFDEAILYHTPDYTNLNVWGLIALFVTNILIIAGSYWLALFLPLAVLLKFIAQIAAALWEHALHLISLLSRWLTMAIYAISTLTHKLRKRIGAQVSQDSNQAINPALSLDSV